MNQYENCNFDKAYEKQLIDNYERNSISKIFDYIDQKIHLSLQENTDSIYELQYLLYKMDDKLQLQTKISNIDNIDIISMKQQINDLKAQVDNQNKKINEIMEETVTQNSKKIKQITEIISNNDIELLKCELKNLKEQLQSSEYLSTQSFRGLKTNKLENEKSSKMKSSLSPIKLEYSKIIKKPFIPNDQVSSEFLANTIEDEDSCRIETKTSEDINEVTVSNSFISFNNNSFIDNQNKLNELTEKVEFLKQDNEALMHEVEELKKATQQASTIQRVSEKVTEALHKAMDASFAAYEARSLSYETSTSLFDALSKSNAASFMSAEAEEHAAAANEKADRIVSDNDKMNVDIRCLKYEVKKLRARVLALEESDGLEQVDRKVGTCIEKVNRVKSDMKKVRNDVKKLKESSNASDELAAKVDDVRSLASKIEAEMSDSRDREERVREQVSKLVNDSYFLKADIVSIRSEIGKIKDTNKCEEGKAQKKNRRRWKNSRQ